MALARASDDPALKQYYEELALKFVQNVENERDLRYDGGSDGGNTNPIQ